MQFFKNQLFIDKHGRSMYYQDKTKIAYVIPKDDMTKFKLYHNRIIVAIVAFVLADNYFFTTPYAIGLAVLLYLYLEWYFRNKLMRNYALIKNFDVSTIPSKTKSNKVESMGKSVLRIALYLAFGILLVVNAHLEQYDLPIVMGSYAVALFAAYHAIVLILALAKTKK